ncbi:MAG: amidohydrolase family protein, partial [Chloroflexi bacterium]|nr:amidohydrolase family protein [Chloroflexota bacterium]
MVRAIDVHIHPPAPGRRTLTSDPDVQAYFRSAITHETAEEMAEYYAELDIFGVLFQIDFETASGTKPVPNDYIAELVERYPKQFAGFGSVDPWKGQAAVREAERCFTELNLRGLKFHP